MGVEVSVDWQVFQDLQLTLYTKCRHGLGPKEVYNQVLFKTYYAEFLNSINLIFICCSFSYPKPKIGQEK